MSYIQRENPFDALFGCMGLLGGFSALLMIGTCKWIDWYESHGRLPTGLDYRVLQTDNESGFREGCSFTAYQLTPESAAQVARIGVSGLNHMRLPKESPSNPYQPWRETPATLAELGEHEGNSAGEYLFAMGASGGCSESGRPVAVHVARLLKERGNFYSYTANREGLIVISPKRRQAIYMYFG